MKAEGWYVDPYGLHDARWFSEGTPTSLVRDVGVESHDPPPATDYTGELEPGIAAAPTGPDDLRRADGTDGPFDPDAEADAAWESFGETTGGD